MTLHTPTTLRVFRALERFIDLRGFPPTYRELGDELNVSAVSAREQIVKLERQGFIRRDRNFVRGLHILKRPVRRSTLLNVAGEVRADGTIQMGIR